MKIEKRQSVFSCRWFEVIAKTVAEEKDAPYFCLELNDYVSILAVTSKSEILLVRQYRPSVEQVTLELPSGHVEKGELPEEAARRELLEETGYQAKKMELLCSFWPDTGRLSNRMWCYFATEVVPHPHQVKTDDNLELVLCLPHEFVRHLKELTFNHALSVAPLFIAGLQKKLFDLSLLSY